MVSRRARDANLTQASMHNSVACLSILTNERRIIVSPCFLAWPALKADCWAPSRVGCQSPHSAGVMYRKQVSPPDRAEHPMIGRGGIFISRLQFIWSFRPRCSYMHKLS